MTMASGTCLPYPGVGASPHGRQRDPHRHSSRARLRGARRLAFLRRLGRRLALHARRRPRVPGRGHALPSSGRHGARCTSTTTRRCSRSTSRASSSSRPRHGRMGTAIVDITIKPEGGGTKVVLREDPGDPLTAFVFNPLTHLLVRGRNGSGSSGSRGLAEDAPGHRREGRRPQGQDRAVTPRRPSCPASPIATSRERAALPRGRGRRGPRRWCCCTAGRSTGGCGAT